MSGPGQSTVENVNGHVELDPFADLLAPDSDPRSWMTAVEITALDRVEAELEEEHRKARYGRALLRTTPTCRKSGWKVQPQCSACKRLLNAHRGWCPDCRAHSHR